MSITDKIVRAAIQAAAIRIVEFEAAMMAVSAVKLPVATGSALVATLAVALGASEEEAASLVGDRYDGQTIHPDNYRSEEMRFALSKDLADECLCIVCVCTPTTCGLA